MSKTLYRQSMELAVSGLGSDRIARELSQRYSLNISPRTIAHWIAGDRRPQLRNIFEEKPSPNLSYVIGAAKGDGCSLLKSGIVKLEVTDRDFAVKFNLSMAALFRGKTPNKVLIRRFGGARKALYIMKYSSRQLVELLARPLKELWGFAKAFPLEFLRGFFDAEGHADVTAKSALNVAIGADNCNPFFLVLVKRTLLKAYGIRATIRLKRPAGFPKVIRGKSFVTRRASYTIYLNRLDDVLRFSSEIGFSIGRKNEKLDDVLRIQELHGHKIGAQVWKQSYFKRKGEWTRFRTIHGGC